MAAHFEVSNGDRMDLVEMKVRGSSCGDRGIRIVSP